MAGSDITVSSLVAVDDVKGIKLSWSYTDPRNGALPSIALGAVEVWAATSNDRAHGSFAKVGEGVSNFSHAGLNRGDVRYYWSRARNVRGSYGDWHPSSATAGVVGTEVSGDVVLAVDGYVKHPSGIIDQWSAAVVENGNMIRSYLIPFPNEVFSIIATLQGPVLNSRTVSVDLYDNSSFSVKVVDESGDYQQESIFWRAIGY